MNLKLWIVIYVAVVSLISTVDSACIGSISLEVYNALHDLYNSTDGANWFWDQTSSGSQIWEFPVDLSVPCSVPWYGLTCVAAKAEKTEVCSISEIRLNSFHLEGTIPPSIGNLTDLVSLEMNENLLYSSLPSNIGSLSKLISIDLAFNELGGSIPMSFFKLELLQNISLYFNDFTGTLPPEMIAMRSLRILNMYANRLHGLLPDTIGYLIQLEEIGLDTNSFESTLPESLGYLSNMVLFQLDANRLFGTFPTSLCTLTGLQKLTLDNNFLDGPIPSCIGNMTSLYSLNLYVNKFTGTIPTELGLLTAMNFLSINTNKLLGPIPTEIGNMFRLSYLSLNGNQLNGSIPTELGKLTAVQQLELYSNSLTGTVPTSLGNLSSVTWLLLYRNSFTGTIPTELCSLSNAQYFFIEYNNFTGTIPTQIGQLTSLTEINFGNNFMTGTLPTEVGKLTNLILLSLQTNPFTGNIPTEVGNLQQLTQLLISICRFGGNIPTELGKLTSMVVFMVESNQFSGTFPNIFHSMASLSTVYFGSNYFIGPIPTDFANFSSVRYIELNGCYFDSTLPAFMVQSPLIREFAVNDNLLTGTIPQFPEVFYDLEIIYFQSNFFTGTIPEFFGPVLKAIFLDSNYLTGEIPSSIGRSINLESFTAGHNYLTGIIPTEVGSLLRLEVLNISTNLFRGNIVDLFENNTSLRRMELLDVSQNGLTGTVPTALFTSDSVRSSVLKEVVIYSNCFTGSLPESICESKSLTAIVMDGLCNAPACRKSFGLFLDSIFKVQISRNRMQGTIPSCFWTMPELLTLHLSGNGFQGVVGDLVNGTTQLRDVSLASNQLVGTLPSSWQHWGKFNQLDLSSNKLSGTLVNNFLVAESNSNLDLTVNRLSGEVPSTFRYAADINVLDGNLFQCNSQTVPENDPDKISYVCGSTDFNDSAITWLFLFVVAVILGGKYISVIRDWFNSYEAFVSSLQKLYAQQVQRANTQPQQQILLDSSLLSFMKCMRCVCYVCFYQCALYVFVVMPMYVIFKSVHALEVYYSTHVHQYLWTTTVNYLHGVGPALFTIGVLFLSIGILIVSVLNGFPTIATNSICSSLPSMCRSWLPAVNNGQRSENDILDLSNSEDNDQQARRSQQSIFSIAASSLKHKLLIALVLAVHMLVTITINVFYVYALISGASADSSLTMQFGLSLFKLAWNNVAVPFGLKKMNLTKRLHLVCSVFMLLFTFLVSPLVASFFSADSCFRYIVSGQPAVSSTFTTNELTCRLDCATAGNDILQCHDFCRYTVLDQEVVTTIVSPSWLYSFQCSSSVVRNYVPVLLFAYVVSGILLPILNVLYAYLPKSLVDGYVPKALRYSHINDTLFTHSSEVDVEKDIAIEEKPVFNAIAILSKLSLDVAVMMTFGLASPLLAVAITVDIWMTLFRFKILIQRYAVLFGLTPKALEAMNDISSNYCIQRLEQATNRVLDGLWDVTWLIICMGLSFWGFFVFDMIGDVYGANYGGLAMGLIFVGALSISMLLTTFWKPSISSSSSSASASSTSPALSGARGISVAIITPTNPLLLKEELLMNESFDGPNRRQQTPYQL